MPRVLLLCTSIVAAFQLHLVAATPVVAHVPVTPSVAALAARVNMDLTRDRARFVPEIIRRVYSPPPSRQIATGVVVGASESLSGAPMLVEVPLTSEVWSSAVFRRRIPPEQLLAAILADRRAALLCRGLAAADDETLAYYDAHPALLSFIYERAAAAFSAFAGSLRIHGGRLIVPGGAPAQSLWEQTIPARADDPDAFVRALFLDPQARTAYLFDVLATASPDARAFALGLWMDDEALRLRRFHALALAVGSTYREWHVDQLPFARPLSDLAILLLRIRVGANGAPAPPAERRFWATALDTTVSDGGSEPAAISHPLVDAAWLIQATSGDMYARGEKLDQFAFGQRVFGTDAAAAADNAAGVVREMPTRRMLLLGLERAGVTRPEVYAAALRQARALAEGGPDRFWTYAQMQGTVALLLRMRGVATLDRARTETLLQSLFAIPLQGGEPRGALAEWIESTLGPSLPAGDTWQARAVSAAAGGPTPRNPRVEWEGQRYRLDLAFAERRRIQSIQAHQGGPDLDVALALARFARRAARVSSIESARSLPGEAQQLGEAYGARLVRPPASAFSAGVPMPRDGREWLTRAGEEIDRGVRAGDLRRVTKAGESLIGLADMALGHAMLSLVYAIHLGDPDGPALLGGNVALRHDFGFNRQDGEGRAKVPWSQPRQDFQPGVPWHVAGSLIGLDAGLAPLALHRLSMEGLAVAPRLQSIEREAFAVNVALLDPRRLDDLTRDRIVAAIDGGRRRVDAVVAAPAELDRLESDLGLDGWRARSLRWVLQNDPASMENQLSLAELFVLGGGATDGLDAWGASGTLTYGCECARFPDPRIWRVLAGRPQMAMMAAANVEMNLLMTQRLASLRLPAALLPSVLETAMQDFVDQVDAADPNDFDALVRYGRALGRNAVADYVAATATLDGPLVSEDADSSEP